MTKDQEFHTPYDHPRGVWQRLIFPIMEKGYRQGVEATIKTLQNMDWDRMNEKIHQ